MMAEGHPFKCGLVMSARRHLGAQMLNCDSHSTDRHSASTAEPRKVLEFLDIAHMPNLARRLHSSLSTGNSNHIMKE